MHVVIDIEANGLENPDQIWLIVCKDIDTGEIYKFRNVTTNEFSREEFKLFVTNVNWWVGHNILGYDLPVLEKLLHPWFRYDTLLCSDTLVISKLVDYSRDGGHSVEQYGEEFRFEKKQFFKFTDPSLYNSSSILFQELENYCVRDVEISYKIYLKYKKVIDDPQWKQSIENEQSFQKVVNSLRSNGFAFNTAKANKLLDKVNKELGVLDEQILSAFPPKLKPVREVHPKVTKHGTLSKTDFRFVKDGDLSEYNGGPFTRCSWVEFNPASHKQLVEVLNGAGWQPLDKTQTSIDTEREINRLKFQKGRQPELDTRLKDAILKMEHLKIYGWKINETNLNTLPPKAPAPARLLAKRILLEARRRTLTEWLGLVSPDTGRIHGRFYGIGAWTHRMAHQQPNTANIPTGVKLYGDEMRSLWQAEPKRLLVGVDAEGIQLRIFAHYIDDPEFTEALVKGKKDDKTDPHSLNQRILGSACRSRQDAKRFIYALLLGAGIPKLAAILGATEEETKEALKRLLERYEGWKLLKERDIPRDGKRGYFIGLDGRRVVIPGDTEGARKHLATSGYLQNGEAVVMKLACLKWADRLKDYDACLVNFVHDEWQTECPNDFQVALSIAKLQADSLRQVGEDLGLKCPLAGSYWNDDLKDYTIGTNWKVTH